MRIPSHLFGKQRRAQRKVKSGRGYTSGALGAPTVHTEVQGAASA